MILLESLLFSFNLEQQPSEQRWKQPFKGRQNFHQHISVLSVGIRKLKHQAQSILKTNLIFFRRVSDLQKKKKKRGSILYSVSSLYSTPSFSLLTS